MSEPGAPHGDETTASERTREELRALIAGRLARSAARAAPLRLATRLIVEEALEAEVEDALGARLLRARAAAGAGYRNGTPRPPEDRRRGRRLRRAAGRDRDAPFRSALREGLKGGPRRSRIWRSSCSPAGWHARHRRCLHRWRRPAAAWPGGGQRDRRAAVGGLPGVRDARPRASTTSPICLSTASPSGCGPGRSASRCWRPGATGRGTPGSAASDGRIERGCRDGDRLLRGHEAAWSQRPASGDLGRRARHHQGDRGVLPACCPPALPGASHAQPRSQGAGGRLAGLQGAGPGRLPGAEPCDSARSCRRRRRRLRPRRCERGRLLHGRLRGLHRPPAIAGHPSPGDPHHG